MSEFKKIDNVMQYVKDGLANGIFVPFQAEKFARIIARRGNIGESVVTWSIKDNKPIIEKDSKVTLDSETNQPGWVVTKAFEDGTPVIDEFGHTNDWIIEDSTFIKKYELEADGIYRPVGGVQVFVQLTEDVSLAQWGGYEDIGAGGYINITNPDDIYGISFRDFQDTYKIVNPSLENKKSR